MGIREFVAATNLEDAADLDSTISSYFNEKLDLALKDIKAANRLGMEYLHCARILNQTAINLRPFHEEYSLELREKARILQQKGYDAPHEFVKANGELKLPSNPVWVQTFLDLGEHSLDYEDRHHLRHAR